MASKSIAIIGPESTGKTTLVAALASHFQVPFATEAARDYLQAQKRQEAVYADMLPIAHLQRAKADHLAGELAAQGGRFYLLDTCLFSTTVWSQLLYGEVPAAVTELAAREAIDLLLLTDIDLPFVPDPMRCFPEPADRQNLMHTMQSALLRAGKSYHLVRGIGEVRTQNAIHIINTCL
jgi:NadR type nicotinamide-nucleotide adenylyltransferase